MFPYFWSHTTRIFMYELIFIPTTYCCVWCFQTPDTFYFISSDITQLHHLLDTLPNITPLHTFSALLIPFLPSSIRYHSNLIYFMPLHTTFITLHSTLPNFNQVVVSRGWVSCLWSYCFMSSLAPLHSILLEPLHTSHPRINPII